jgi:hypothetical protein
MIRTAISPRLATKTFLIMIVVIGSDYVFNAGKKIKHKVFTE